jgi:sigma-E factor negative regulatory protein RseA
MDMKNMTHEQISVFSDGELAFNQMDTVLAALRHQQGQVAWDVYHHIGDILRSDEMAFSLSPSFMARLTVRLEAEPTVIAPAILSSNVEVNKKTKYRHANLRHSSIKHFILPGIAAAAVLVLSIGFLNTQQELTNTSSSVAGISENKIKMVSSDLSSPATLTQVNRLNSIGQPGEVVLRDSRIDEYLLAHQRFSPSLYSTAQYARSATFATEPIK